MRNWALLQHYRRVRLVDRESTTKAYQLRDRASDREKFFIDLVYYRTVTGDLEKARQTCEVWEQTYPRDMQPHSFLSRMISSVIREIRRGGAEARKAMTLDPDHSFPYFNLAASYIYRDRLDEARASLDRAAERNIDLPELFVARFQIAFLENNRTEMDRLAMAAHGRSPGKDWASDWITDQQAAVLAYSGHLQLARGKSQRAVDLARQAGRPDGAAQHEAAMAVREALFGNADERAPERTPGCSSSRRIAMRSTARRWRSPLRVMPDPRGSLMIWRGDFQKIR